MHLEAAPAAGARAHDRARRGGGALRVGEPRGHHRDDGAIRRAVTLALEARVSRGLDDGIAIPPAHAAREGHDLLVRHTALTKRGGAFSNFGDGVHHDTDDRALISPRLLDGPRRELSADALVGVQRLDLDLLLGVEAIADLLVIGLPRPSVSVDDGVDVEKLEDTSRGRLVGQSGRSPEQVSNGVHCGAHPHDRERSQCADAAFNRGECRREGRAEVGLVEDEQTVLSNQPGLECAAPGTHAAVCAEKKARTNHVDCANDDCGARRVVPPSRVERALAPERGHLDDRRGAACVLQRRRDCAERVGLILRGTLETFAYLLGELGSLIDDHAAIDDVREPTRYDARLARERAPQRQNPQHDDRGLAQARGQLDVGREAPRFEVREEPVLPAARAVVTSQRAVERVEVLEREDAPALPLVRGFDLRAWYVGHQRPFALDAQLGSGTSSPSTRAWKNIEHILGGWY
jgi:hypothetical protein